MKSTRDSITQAYDALERFRDEQRQSLTDEEWDRFIHGALQFWDDEIFENDKDKDK